jgi:hypothetical protein
MMLCPRCREPLADPPEPFCARCGAAVDGPPDPPAPPSAPTESAADAAPAEAGAETLPPLPTPVVEPEVPPPVAGIPWDERERLGFATALIDTTLQVLRRPSDFYRRMRPTGGMGSALAYAVLLAYGGFVASVFYDWIFQAVVGGNAPELGLGPDVDRAMALMQGGLGHLLQLVVAPFWLAAMMFVGAAVDHLSLLLLGGARRGFESTFRVCAFARAANVVALLPMCGPLVTIVWIAVLTIVGLSAVHGISWQKAAAAVLLPFAVFCCCCLGGAGLLAALIAGSIR